MRIFYPKKNTGQAEGVECYSSLTEVQQAAPNCVKVISVGGGWIAFETWADYDTWRTSR